MLAYNQQATVRAAAESLLDQSGEPLEILLSDDASEDGTFDVISAMARDYRGPHLVQAVRNERNLGIGAHLNALVDRSRGDLLIVAAGDDVSRPERAKTLADAWLASNRQLDLIASPLISMDDQGRLGDRIEVDDLRQWQGVDAWIARKPYVVGAAHAWTRRLFQAFGPLDADIAYEDQIMAFRAISRGAAATVSQALVHYRTGGTSARHGTASAADRINRMKVQNRRHLAELRQLTQDAQRVPGGERVTRSLSEEQARQDFLHALLSSPDLASMCRVAVGNRHGAPLGWRWRKFWSVAAAHWQTSQAHA